MDASGGSLFGQVKRLAWVGALLLSAACTQSVQTEPEFNSQTIGLAAQLLEAEFKNQVGKQINDSVRVRSAARDGNTVIVGFTATKKDEAEVFRRQPGLTRQLLAAMLRDELCETPEKRALFNSGLALQTNLYDTAGRKLISTTVKNC